MMQLNLLSVASRDAVRRFQCVAEEFVRALGNLAVVAAIDIRGRGRRYFSAGYFDISRTRLAASNDLFQIGSQSKLIVAMTAVALARAGYLDLDATARSYVSLPLDERITVRHLLMNTAGLGEYLLAMPVARLDPRLSVSPRDLVALSVPQGQIFEPGSQFDYSNTCWVVAAMIIESIAQRPYGDVVREFISQPLSLSDTYLGGGAPVDRMLRGYIKNSATQAFVDIADCHEWAFGAGDGVSSLDDMLTLVGSLLEKNAPASLQELSAQTARSSDTPYSPMSFGIDYGLGIERRAWAGSEVWGHPGSTIAYQSGTWLDANYGVAVTTCVTRTASLPAAEETSIRYPRSQLFAMALNTAYNIANDYGADSKK